MARGISTATIARRAAVIAIAAATATGLSACGAGQVTQTDTKQTAIAGVNVDKGVLALRDLQVEYSEDGYEEGGTAPLRVWVTNEGDEPISLIGVETEAAEDVALVDGGESGVEVHETTEPPQTGATSEAPSGDEDATDQASDGETDEATDGATDQATDGTTEGATDDTTDGATDEATDGATDEPTGDPTTEPAEEETPAETVGFEPIEIAPGAFVRLAKGDEGGDYLVLEGLGERLRSGENITVTFLFSGDREVTVEIPVTAPDTGDADDRTYLEHPGAGH